MTQSPKVMTFINFKFKKVINYLIFFNFYEQIWRCFFIFFTILGATMLKNVIEFLTNPEYNTVSVASLSDFYIIIPVATLTWIIRDLSSIFLKPIIQEKINVLKYPTEEERSERAIVLSKWTMDFFFYLFTSVTTYFILKDTPFLPPSLFGKGDHYKIQPPNFPEIYRTPYLREMYCFQLGTHLYSFVYQVLKRRNDKKYFEYVLHHGMALSLIFFSYSSNYMNSGILCLLTHDFSDVFIVLARGSGDFSFKSKKFLNSLYVCTFSIWCYARLYAFPTTVIWANIFLRHNVQDKYKDLFQNVNIYMVSMTIVLYLMNVYWTIFLIKAQIYFYIKNKIKVDYDEKDKREKAVLAN